MGDPVQVVHFIRDLSLREPTACGLDANPQQRRLTTALVSTTCEDCQANLVQLALSVANPKVVAGG